MTLSPTCPLESGTVRAVPFVGLIVIALLHTLPDKAAERGAYEVGHRLCEASISGQGLPAERSRRFLGLTGNIDSMPDYLRTLRAGFSEKCELRVWRGDLSVDGDGDYVLRLAGARGSFLIMSLKLIGYAPISFEVGDNGAAWPIDQPE